MNHPFLRYRYIFFFLTSLFLVLIFNGKLETTGSHISNKIKIYRTKKDLKIIKNALINTKERDGELPPRHRFETWYKNRVAENLRFKFPLDRWGEPLVYKRYNNKKFILISSGTDRKQGSKDDIIIRSL